MESFERARPQPFEQVGPTGPAQIASRTRTYAPEPPPTEAGMDLNDVARRIFRRHWRLILLCVALVAVPVAVVGYTDDARTYRASARLVLDTQDPKSRSESTSIADTAKALATSPAQVRAALAQAHVTNRNAADVAQHHVSIRALGTSAVVQLSVTDENRHAAAAIANALADRIIRTRLSVSNGQLQDVLTRLDQRIDELNTKIAAADAQIDELAQRLATSSAAQANALRAKRDALSRSRDLLAQQRGVVESERVSLLSADATRPKPSIISAATVPSQEASSHLPAYLALAVLLGLILGIGCAGIVELIRPTVAGSERVAGALNVPLLGTLPKEPLADSPAAFHSLRARLRLAAESAGVRTIGVLPVGNIALDTEEATHAELAELLRDEPQDGLSIRPLDIDELARSADNRVGLVAFAPTELSRADLVEFDQLLSLTSLPVLGLITYSRPSMRKRLRRSRRRPGAVAWQS